MPLLTPGNFRVWYPALEGTDSDPELEVIIESAMALISLYLGYPEADDGTRSFALKTYTFDLSGPARLQPLALCLCVRPLVTVTSVTADTTWVFGTPLVQGTDYVVDLHQGAILLKPGGVLTSWPSAFRAIRVVVTAGYATLPSWLLPLVVEVTRHLWNRRATQGQESFGFAGDSASLADADALLPKAVRDLLDPLRMCA